jgi:SAM-dependent methyltransferase
MSIRDSDKGFTGSIPELYERMLVPLIFEPYAVDLARRIASMHPANVLEIAAGTGVLTRELALQLNEDCEITATDLNEPMLNVARQKGTTRSVRWQTADALQLPFGEDNFDVVACQFGAMFFPDRVRGFAEVRRVLKSSGLFIFNVWDRIQDNLFADVVTGAVGRLFPEDPPQFMARTPHGYHDAKGIADDLRGAGFKARPDFETVTKISRAASARIAAIAYCQGTPLRSEIEARDASRLQEATDASEQALVSRFGSGVIEAKIQAIVVSITK